ncbi:hypothetical protein RQM65_17390 [Pricia sp. S334]|uniref:DUF3325 domain-containing protein n=1 Tax=Pricia mediterranea TaxID=3076079 RepID=A0ABU3LAY8_9FLAO|nr:hypothetical protein [Pricia sp. S334]MDT7830446.1 hypothetical protein [Pricia sp. S334]
MITLTVGLTFIGFFLSYNTSKRAKPANGKIRDWAKKNPKISIGTGIAFLVAGLALAVVALGLGSGIFSFLVILMLLGSLTVLVSPLHFFSLKGLILLVVIALLIELNLT